jgi:hypothetical protein
MERFTLMAAGRLDPPRGDVPPRYGVRLTLAA